MSAAQITLPYLGFLINILGWVIMSGRCFLIFRTILPRRGNNASEILIYFDEGPNKRLAYMCTAECYICTIFFISFYNLACTGCAGGWRELVTTVYCTERQRTVV